MVKSPIDEYLLHGFPIAGNGPVLLGVLATAPVVWTTTVGLLPIAAVAVVPVVVGLLAGAIEDTDAGAVKFVFGAVVLGALLGIAGGLAVVFEVPGSEAIPGPIPGFVQWGLASGVAFLGIPIYGGLGAVLARWLSRARRSDGENVEVAGDLPD